MKKLTLNKKTISSLTDLESGSIRGGTASGDPTNPWSGPCTDSAGANNTKCGECFTQLNTCNSTCYSCGYTCTVQGNYTGPGTLTGDITQECTDQCNSMYVCQ